MNWNCSIGAEIADWSHSMHFVSVQMKFLNLFGRQIKSSIWPKTISSSINWSLFFNWIFFEDCSFVSFCGTPKMLYECFTNEHCSSTNCVPCDQRAQHHITQDRRAAHKNQQCAIYGGVGTVVRDRRLRLRSFLNNTRNVIRWDFMEEFACIVCVCVRAVTCTAWNVCRAIGRRCEIEFAGETAEIEVQSVGMISCIHRMDVDVDNKCIAMFVACTSIRSLLARKYLISMQQKIFRLHQLWRSKRDQLA